MNAGNTSYTGNEAKVPVRRTFMRRQTISSLLSSLLQFPNQCVRSTVVFCRQFLIGRVDLRATASRHRSATVTIAVALLLLLAGREALSQVTVAAIHGNVTDPSGAAIPSAKISAFNTTTGITTRTTTDQAGYFIFPSLQVGGPYTVTVSAPEFADFVTSGLTLNVNDNREVLASLKLQGTEQSVEVTATALQVETSNTQLEQIVTASQLESVPLEGRDPAGMQKFEPGVVESSDRFGTYSSNGNQTQQNDFILDGTDINDAPLQAEGLPINPDALQEENIVTSTMNPEFSRNSGAIVNEITKSGTNTLHGSAFEFYRDTFMNNGNYFSITRPIFHQNLYGGTLGGPIVKNKFFFLLAYQGFRNVNSETETSSTLSGTKGSSATGNFAGNFSGDVNWLTGNYNNVAGLSGNPIPFNIGSCAKGTAWNACFPSGTVVIPPAAWNSVSSALVTKYVPQANYGAIYDFNALNTAASDQAILRADYTPSSRDTIWASSVIQSSPTANAAFLWRRQLPRLRPARVGTFQDLRCLLYAYLQSHEIERAARRLLSSQLPFGDTHAGAVAQLAWVSPSIRSLRERAGFPTSRLAATLCWATATRARSRAPIPT